MSSLATSLTWLGTQMEQAVEPVQPVVQMIAEFVIWVLERLPFGIGSQARAGLEGMQTILSDLPELIDGVNTQVLDPLAEWFGADERRSLAGILLTPISQGVMTPAGSVLDSVAGFEETFLDGLVTPAQEALARRAEVREQIRHAQARIGQMA
jgi:hypothetical protein